MLITVAYIAVAVFNAWSFGEIRRIDDEKASLMRRGARFSGNRPDDPEPHSEGTKDTCFDIYIPTQNQLANGFIRHLS